MGDEGTCPSLQNVKVNSLQLQRFLFAKKTKIVATRHNVLPAQNKAKIMRVKAGLQGHNSTQLSSTQLDFELSSAELS